MARSVESMVKTETLSRELLGHVGKVPVSSIDRFEVGARTEAGVGGLGVDPHQGATGLPPQVPKIVVGVAKDTHLGSAQPIMSGLQKVQNQGPLQTIL